MPLTFLSEVGKYQLLALPRFLEDFQSRISPLPPTITELLAIYHIYPKFAESMRLTVHMWAMSQLFAFQGSV